MSDDTVVTKEFLAQEFDRQFEKFAIMMKGGFDDVDDQFGAVNKRFDALETDLAEFKSEMYEFRDEMREFQTETREEFRQVKGDIRTIQSDMTYLTERVDNMAGFAKEIDDHGMRITQNEKDIILLKTQQPAT